MNLRVFAEGAPKTELLYWRNSYIKDFTGKVVKSKLEKGRRAYLILDATAFHPKTGGQPSDQGILVGEGMRVKVGKVLWVSGVVVHVGRLAEGRLSEGAEVQGFIDWELRHSVMRRHTANHLLDYCLSEVLGYPVETLDCWFGEPCYATYKGAKPSPSTLRRVERLVNKLIAENRKVYIRWVPRRRILEEISEAPNRFRLPSLEVYRVVYVEGFHGIPCSGTHVSNIEEVGEFKILRVKELNMGFRIFYKVS